MCSSDLPYKGTTQAVLASVAGQVQVVFGDMIHTIPQFKSGKLRALGVTTPRRAPQLPDVPTLIEAGLPGFDSSLWWAMFYPRGTSGELVGQLNGVLGRILKSPDVRQKYAELGVDIEHGTPRELADAIRTRGDQVGKLLKAAGVQPE